MYQNILGQIFIVFLLLISVDKSYGHLMAASMPLTQIVRQSNVIILGRIISCPQDMAKDVQKTTDTSSLSIDNIIDAQETIKPAGTYNFAVLSTIKGEPYSSLTLVLPALSKVYYNFAGMNISKGDQVLIFLTTDAQGELTPADPTLPLIKLSGATEEPLRITSDTDPLLMVTSFMVRSLSDPGCRQANTYLLRDIVQPRVIPEMAALINDPNIHVQNNVLYYLVANQVVNAIPQMIRLRRTGHLSGQELDCELSLQKLTAESSVPYLNKLLMQPDEALRINAMLALPRIADESSIPYLILALRDPEPQGIVSHGAYFSLARLIATSTSPRQSRNSLIKRNISSSDFIEHRERLTLPLHNWWNDELMGVHFHTAEQVPGRSAEQAEDKVGQLNLETFNPDPSTRRKSIKLLVNEANHTSIPFLVLALQDPDSSVAFGAYKILHHLVPALGPAKDATAFNVKRAAVSQPVYDWWRDELLGKHLSK